VRIIAGAWRGRALSAPPGDTTRPTADRLRQALFDMLWHASWCGRERLEGAAVLDVFAGTGALGLEALSRGAAHATFIEQDRAALTVLRANVMACRAEANATILAADATRPPPGGSCGIVFLDPPYGRDLVPAAVNALAERGWLAADALLVTETARDENPGLAGELLAERVHGAGRIAVWRHAG
jgi:16S rRNA (guanine966-N2)-methyltransferase